MQELLRWLAGNSSPLSVIGSIGVVLIAAALATAAFRRARAVIAQATARTQVEADDLQTGTGTPFAEKETFPNILVAAATNREGVIEKDTLAIVNMGGGNAHDLRLRYRDESSSHEISLDKQVLVVRGILRVPFDGSRGAASGFQLTFRTDFGTQYALEFEWEENDSRALNEKLILIPPGSLATENFKRS